MEEPWLDGKILLMWMLKLLFKAVDLIYLDQNLAMESCMHGDGILGSIKGGQFLESLSNCQLLRRTAVSDEVKEDGQKL